MTSNKLVRIASFIGAFFISGTASAGQIVDVETPNALVNLFQPLEYTHNLNDNGFVWGTALNASIAIDIYDDEDAWFLDPNGQAGEFALIVVEDLDFDTGGIWGTLEYSAPAGWVSDLDIEAFAELNADGFLSVWITGLGDFFVGSSTLTVNTVDPVAAPEPGMLSLIALSLMGLAGVSRRRRMS